MADGCTVYSSGSLKRCIIEYENDSNQRLFFSLWYFILPLFMQVYCYFLYNYMVANMFKIIILFTCFLLRTTIVVTVINVAAVAVIVSRGNFVVVNSCCRLPPLTTVCHQHSSSCNHQFSLLSRDFLVEAAVTIISSVRSGRSSH